MLTRRLAHPLNVSKFGIYIFQLHSFKGDELVMIADDGFPDAFRAELRFSGVRYIACPTGFAEMEFRILTKQEFGLSHIYPDCTIFGFEVPLPHLSKEPEKYLIVARDVEITMHSDVETLSRIEEFLEPLEMKDRL